MSPTRPPTATSRPATPRSEAELRARAEALAGHDLGALADALGVVIPGDPRRTKGKWGELLERALGATAGSRSEPDFPHLGVELKTVPMRADGRAIESTYVCRIDLARAEELEGETSAARRKLLRVLWIPLLAADADWRRRRIGTPRLWSPTPEQEAALRTDFDEIIGALATGRVEEITARWGRVMQVRPKAATGKKTFVTTTADGDLVATVPKGFYLRARFVSALIADPRALVATSPR